MTCASNIKEHQILFKVFDLLPGDKQTFEINPPLRGKKITGFKPREIQISVRNLKNDFILNKIEICDIRVMGAPQLLEYSDTPEIRGLTSFFEQRSFIDWSIFFSKEGAGLQITLNNPYIDYIAKVYIALYGDWSEMDPSII